MKNKLKAGRMEYWGYPGIWQILWGQWGEREEWE